MKTYSQFNPQIVHKFNMLLFIINIINKYIYNIRIYVKLQYVLNKLSTIMSWCE